MHPNFLKCLAFGVLLLVAPAARAADSPTATVERLNAALLDVMKNAQALGYQGRYDKLAPVVKATFDFPTMARIVLGGHWGAIGAAQQKAFVDAFTDYSIGVFANRFDGYSGEKFEVTGERPARHGTVLVYNRIVKSDGEPVEINYLTRTPDAGGSWRIIDTILGGAASELAARRSEYDSIIGKLGIDALIRALKAKTAGFAAK